MNPFPVFFSKKTLRRKVDHRRLLLPYPISIIKKNAKWTNNRRRP